MQLCVTEQRKDEDYDDDVEENLLNEVCATATDVFCKNNAASYFIASYLQLHFEFFIRIV